MKGFEVLQSNTHLANIQVTVYERRNSHRSPKVVGDRFLWIRRIQGHLINIVIHYKTIQRIHVADQE